jgi:chemotaxis protein CheX
MSDEWIRQMDDAVAEVFRSMLERSCSAVEETSGITLDISARITLSGTFQADCVVEFPSSTAERLTSAFLPPGESAWDDAMIADAVGELCNMIAGGWKMRLGVSALGSDLSVPAISRVTMHGAIGDTKMPGSIAVRRAYAFDDAPFVVSLSAP